ncbi:hypothetical protein RQP46_003608 [Phenoliferia psychrophenolica]
MGNTKRSVPPEMLDKIFDFLRGSGWRDVAHRLFWQDARITFDHDKRPPRVPDMKHPINHLWIEYLGDGNPRTLEEFMGWGYDSDSDSEAERVIGNDVATDWTMALLEMNPLLKTLCITTEMGISGPNWVFLRTPTLAGLKRLDLEFGNTVYEPRDVTSPFPFHLTHLGLTLYPRPVSSNLLRELFAASRNTLKSLRLTINCEQEWNEPALLHEGITLVSSIVETLVLEFRELWHKSDQSALVAVAAYPNIGDIIEGQGMYPLFVIVAGTTDPILLLLADSSTPYTHTILSPSTWSTLVSSGEAGPPTYPFHSLPTFSFGHGARGGNDSVLCEVSAILVYLEGKLSPKGSVARAPDALARLEMLRSTSSSLLIHLLHLSTTSFTSPPPLPTGSPLLTALQSNNSARPTSAPSPSTSPPPSFLHSSVLLSRPEARKTMGARHGNQVGSPAKGAAAMYKLAIMEDPPLRVVLGSDAYKAMLLKVKTYEERIKAFEEVSLRTDV